jgi:uncharacterized coiled-coil protein SlyX
MEMEGAPPPEAKPAASPEVLEARLAKLESRVARVERKLVESQLLVARKLMEIFAGMKKHQQARDAQIHEALAKLLEQLNELRSRLEPVVSPTTTH